MPAGWGRAPCPRICYGHVALAFAKPFPACWSSSVHGATNSHTVWGPGPGVPVCHCFSWTVHLSFKPRIWLVNHLPQLAQKLGPISNSSNISSPIFAFTGCRKIRTYFLIHEIAIPSTNKIYKYIYFYLPPILTLLFTPSPYPFPKKDPVSPGFESPAF